MSLEPDCRFRACLNSLTIWFENESYFLKIFFWSENEKEKSPTSWTGPSTGRPSASPSCPTPTSTWRPRCRSSTSRCRRSRERGRCPEWPRPSRRLWPRWPPCFRGRSAVPSYTAARALTKEHLLGISTFLILLFIKPFTLVVRIVMIVTYTAIKFYLLAIKAIWRKNSPKWSIKTASTIIYFLNLWLCCGHLTKNSESAISWSHYLRFTCCCLSQIGMQLEKRIRLLKDTFSYHIGLLVRSISTYCQTSVWKKA